MNEEEKEAIEEFKSEYNDGMILESDIIIELDTARIVIDLIDKLQKENEEYHRIKKDLIRVNKKIYDVDTIDEFIKTIEKLQKENAELKEKIKEYEIGKEQE